jgi:hypothetical protein
MDKTLAGVIGAVGALVATAPAHAAIAAPVTVRAAMQADSYADLLRPIPNALALLQAEELAPDEPVAGGEAKVELVQYHHHHHHHHVRRRRWRHHHWEYY